MKIVVSRVAIISEHASPMASYGGCDSGGQNVYVEQVALNLACLDIEVDVYTRRTSPSTPEVARWKGIRVISITAGPMFPIPKEELPPYMEEFSRNILKFIQEQKLSYSVAHANFWMSGLACVYLKHKLGLPFVVTFHALGKVRRNFFGKEDVWGDERSELEQKIIEAADAVIAECPQDEYDLFNLYNTSPRKVRLIPCGYDDFEFWQIDQGRAREYLNFPQNEFIISNIGRIVPRKGIDNVIHAIAILRERYQIIVRLAVVGGETDTPDPEKTPEMGRLMNIAAMRGVLDQVLFAGRKSREELKYYYSASDVFVTTPWYEPFGITPLEAMACGVPVVGSKVGGIKYSVQDGQTGLLVEPNNPEQLAQALFTLYQNPDLRELFAEQGKTRVAQFRWDKIAASLLFVYEEVLSRQPLHSETEFASIYSGINSLEAACGKVREAIPFLAVVAQRIQNCFANGGKLLLAGNGGSAAQCQHLAAEFVGQFQAIRKGLPAIALTADTSLLTAWANDVSFIDVFARQVETFAQSGDIFLCLSTSGNSRNLICAIDKCKKMKIPTIAILGNDGGEIAHLADLVVIVPGENPQRIQEMQLFALHLLVELIEQPPKLEPSRIKNGKSEHKLYLEIS